MLLCNWFAAGVITFGPWPFVFILLAAFSAGALVGFTLAAILAAIPRDENKGNG